MLIAEIERYVTTLYPAYREGHLLVAGGLADQPARYLAMIRAMTGLSDKIEERYLELTKPPEDTEP